MEDASVQNVVTEPLVTEQQPVIPTVELPAPTLAPIEENFESAAKKV
jgi:hypothetical protein